ncbi:rhodanese-like domain-containing protein [Tenacibaculum sp. MEBiC06402]|uniref:rhodanese-like domain-containing protein n=1 Tax=unclassified Tenacibaculum TaxID=2635139 RepID=UPI003B9BEE13
MKKLLLSLLLITVITSCVKSDSRVKNITVDDLKVILQQDKNIQLLDVRTSSEAKNGIIFDAVQVNLISNNFESRVIEVLDKKQPVYVYCRSGGRSKIAASVLVKNGFDVYNVKGGYKEWIKKNKIE